MADINGTAQGVGDSLRGTSGDDKIQGFSGDDVIKAGRGDDEVIGGRGNDVMFGGVGADTFTFSAGHIGDGETDYIADFNITKGDSLKFLDSGSGDFVVKSVELAKLTETEANGVDLKNNVDKGTDIVFTVYHSETGAEQEIVVLDAWSNGLNSAWEALLADMGLSFGSQMQEEPEICEETHSGVQDLQYAIDESLTVM